MTTAQIDKKPDKRGKSAASLANLTGGSRKGIPNKTTASIKDAFKQAFEGMGGAQALQSWGAENPNLFYPLASKLIPAEIVGKDGDHLVPVIDEASSATRLAAILAEAARIRAEQEK